MNWLVGCSTHCPTARLAGWLIHHSLWKLLRIEYYMSPSQVSKERGLSLAVSLTQSREGRGVRYRTKKQKASSLFGRYERFNLKKKWQFISFRFSLRADIIPNSSIAGASARGRRRNPAFRLIMGFPFLFMSFPSANQRSHTRHCPPRNVRPPTHLPFLFVTITTIRPNFLPSRLFQQVLLAHIPHSIAIVTLTRFLCVGNKYGPKGGDGHHDDGRAGFNFVPEYLPDDVCLRGANSNLRHAHDGDDYHHDGEAKSGAEDKFLAERHLDAPKEVDWDCQYYLKKKTQVSCWLEDRVCKETG